MVKIKFLFVFFRIKDILPELAEECNLSTKQITEDDESVVDTFYELTATVNRKPDYCCRVRDYDLVFKKIMGEKGLTWDDFKDV